MTNREAKWEPQRADLQLPDATVGPLPCGEPLGFWL